MSSARERYTILQVAAMPFPTHQGSQVYVGGMCQALARRGHRVILACYHHGSGPDPEGVEVVRARRVPGGDVASSGPHWARPAQDLLLVRAVTKVLRRERVDLIHAHNVEAPVVARVARERVGSTVPLVYNLHTLMGEELSTYVSPRLQRMAGLGGRALDRALPRLCEGSLAISSRAEAALERRGARHVAKALPGLDPSDLQGADGQRARQRFRLGQGDWVVYAGNADAYQDLDVLVQAMVHTRDARLLVVSGSDLGHLERQARGLGLGPDRVRLERSARFEDARDALAMAAVAVLPRTTCAGFPIKLLNQLALGVPTVVSEGSWQPELPGQVRVPDDAPPILGRTIQDLLDQPGRRRRLSAAAREHMRLHGTWDARAAEVEELYRSLLL